MNGNMKVHGHCNGLKTVLLFGLMWAVIMLIWWLTGASEDTLGMYLIIGVASTFISYWFSDRIAIASMGARHVSEQEAPELYRIVRELSARAGKPMPRIYIAPTMSPNAFATGRNEHHAAVCCTQGILQILNERELRGVLGHELMHVYNHDILTSAIASAMATVITYLGYALMYFGGGDDDDRDSGPLGFLGVMLSAILAISYGVKECPMQATAGNQSTAAMMIESPFSEQGFQKLFSTHPPTADRINRLMQMAHEMHGTAVTMPGGTPQVPYQQTAQPVYSQYGR